MPRRHKKTFPRSVLLTMQESENQCKPKKITVVEDVHDPEIDKDNWVEVDVLSFDNPDETNKQKTNAYSKIPIRKVPNILKNSLKIHVTAEVPLLETIESPIDMVDVDDIAETSFNSTVMSDSTVSEGKLINEEPNKGAKKLFRKRKQKYNSTNVRQDYENWDMESWFIQGAQELVVKKERSRTCSQKTKLRLRKKIEKVKPKNTVRKQSKKEQDLLSSGTGDSRDTVTDGNFEYPTYSSVLQENEQGLQNYIDFSSNNIFNEFDYEFSTVEYSDYLRKFVTSSNETHSSIHGSDTYDKEYDINGNDINTCSLMPDKAYEQSTLENQYSMTESVGKWRKDILFLGNNEPKCSFESDSCCNYNSEECTLPCKNAGVSVHDVPDRSYVNFERKFSAIGIPNGSTVVDEDLPETSIKNSTTLWTTTEPDGQFHSNEAKSTTDFLQIYDPLAIDMERSSACMLECPDLPLLDATNLRGEATAQNEIDTYNHTSNSEPDFDAIEINLDDFGEQERSDNNADLSETVWEKIDKNNGK